MHDSQQLLVEYARTGSETAFAELVGRYIDLVHSTAYRLLDGDADQAKDAAQFVFVDLARKAPTLSSEVMLGGWLHRHTCFVVANMRRGERRRQARERKAVAMNSIEDHSEENLAELKPILDQAINELDAEDRTAILLRYFEQCNFSAVGAAMGSSENAAQKRVSRALDELRALLMQRGVSLSVIGLGTVLSKSAISAAPHGLAAAISDAALISAATPSTVGKGMTMGKLKIGIASAIIIGGAAACAFLYYQSIRNTIVFDGQRWNAWKMKFAVRGDKLVSLPKVRPGFNYGHSGGGRGPVLMSNIGSHRWKDYRAAFEYCVSGVNPSFNPYGLPLDYHDGEICFHVADVKESWNVRGQSTYVLDASGDGSWKLWCVYNSYCAVPSGFGNCRMDEQRTLAQGTGLNIDRQNGNKYVIEVKGHRIQIWVDGEQIADVTDDKMGETIGGQTLDHGGVGFVWGLDAMGWIRHFSMTPL